jgi:hypothetical protein
MYSNMHFHYHSRTGSIKSSLQYFDICRVQWLSEILFHLFTVCGNCGLLVLLGTKFNSHFASVETLKKNDQRIRRTICKIIRQN